VSEDAQTPEVPRPGLVQPQPVPTSFNIEACRIGPMPSVEFQIYTPTGIHVIYLSASDARALAMALIENAKAAARIPPPIEIADTAAVAEIARRR
jgi:hypothetical protein